MKRNILVVITLLFNVALFAQNSPVDDMFAKYSGQDGITSISISSKMFSMLAGTDLQDEDLNNLMKQLKTIRIITIDSAGLNKKINFNEELSKKLNPAVYEELMVVMEGSKVTRYLTSMTGNIISELVVVTGGVAGNELISIKGDIDLKNISSLTKKLGIDQLKSLEMIDKQSFK
jgi:hypothetical protein